MIKRFSIPSLFVALFASSLLAGPLHSNDPNYRGAVTFLATGCVESGPVRYWTEFTIVNDTNHDVWLRLEVYPTTGGYRELRLVNELLPNAAGGFGWGFVRVPAPPDFRETRVVPSAFAQLLGTNTIGSLRVVAVTEDGAEDPTAKIHGFARLYSEKAAGGRTSELQLGFTDWDLTGPQRRDGRAGFPEATLFIPFDATNSRVNLVVVNFDDIESRVAVGSHTATDVDGTVHRREGFEFEVPARGSAIVPLPLIDSMNGKQVVSLITRSGSTKWASYVCIVDKDTNDTRIHFDYPTQYAMTQR